MSRKARVTVEIECTVPKGFFESCCAYNHGEEISVEMLDAIEMSEPAPCADTGEITVLCIECHHWVKYDEWDSESSPCNPLGEICIPCIENCRATHDCSDVEPL